MEEEARGAGERKQGGLETGKRGREGKETRRMKEKRRGEERFGRLANW